MKFSAAMIILVLSVSNISQAQHPVLYGIVNTGNGGIFRYTESDNTIKNEYRFKNSGIYRRSHMVRGKDGIIYGVAQGGPYGHGIIYSLDPATNKYTIRKNFRATDGDTPNSALVQGKDGTLYGTTSTGGHNGNGVLFSFHPVTSVFRILLHFDDVFFSSPGALTMASDGLLYGIAFYQQTGDYVFSFDPSQKEFQPQAGVPEDFGFFPSEAMIESASGGILYGLMSSGGDNQSGTLFSYSLRSKQLTKHVDFNSTLGINPNGTLTLGSDGKLYSTTSSGGANSDYGTVFCFDPKDNSVKAIHDFDGTNGGSSRGGLTEGDDGKLYGMTLKTIPKGRNLDFVGSIFFSVEKDGNNYTILRSFDHPGWSLGEGNAILVGHKLYGIALAERTNPYEYIFSYETGKNLFQKIVRTNLDKGFAPRENMMQAKDGRFYGITNGGGGYGRGGIFSFNPGTRQYSMLFSFMGQSLTSSEQFVQAANGKLYGVNTIGGTHDQGFIFSFDPDKSRFVIEESFKPGSVPGTGFALGADGNLYSTVLKDDPIEDFVYYIFSFNPTTGQYKEVIKMCCGPATFIPSSDGNLYGSSINGIYRYDPVGNNLQLFPFPDPSSGVDVTESGKLIEAADHKLFGISSSTGLIFSFDPSDGTFAPVFSFSDITGYYSIDNLLYASDGKLYGTTDFGGSYGSLFSIDPTSQSFQLLRQFDELTGDPPTFGQLIELNTTIPPIVSITDKKLFEGETAELMVSLNRIVMEEVTLNYHTVAGTANDGVNNPDFIAASGQVTIPPGEASTTISVPLLEDELMETRETFTVVLQKANEVPLMLGDSIGIINIKNGTVPIIPPGGEIITIAPMLSTVTGMPVKSDLVIRASPNPSSNFFSLNIAGNKTDRVSVTVTNLSGQVLDKFDGVSGHSQLTFGENYLSGSYFLRILAGKKTQVFKLVKMSK